MRIWNIVYLGVFLTIGPGFGQPSTQQLSGGAAARFLEQATWGPTPASIAALQQTGIGNWLNAQFALNISDIPDQPLLDSSGQPNRNIHPVQAAFFQNTVTGQDQLRQRVAFVLSQIWVVSMSGNSIAYAYPPYWRIFRDNAFGNYRDLIRAVTLSPAMGRYLNMANNDKGNPAKNTSANENYARELMQLFTLGLTQLNPDGTPVLDSNTNPVPTYDQTVVTNMAKLLTGWTYPTAPGATPKKNNPQYFFGPMFAVESEHDTSAKAIFNGITIPAGQTAEQDLNSLLDALMAQPTMAPFVSKQLIEHLVTSNPSPQYISRISNIFQDDGTGVTGNLHAVIAAILTDPEARSADLSTAVAAANFGHMREPALFVSNLLRGLNATLTPTSTVYAESWELGEDVFDAPSVFSYFSPQYRIEGGLLGPEFQIYSTQTAADRADIVNALLYGTIDKVTTVNLTPFVQQAGSTTSLLNTINSTFLHGSMSPALEQAATDAVDGATTPLAKAQAALYVVLTSGEYQIIH
ncbi:MAG TPA: DUF1800 domain-containing protein [Bryobacteraceae bacterium]|jgi:uncharacterized protein (DUF1800 family)|nr:DUF1800 domain-containing protein [Bryobacteraceae bacterium]